MERLFANPWAQMLFRPGDHCRVKSADRDSLRPHFGSRVKVLQQEPGPMFRVCTQQGETFYCFQGELERLEILVADQVKVWIDPQDKSDRADRLRHFEYSVGQVLSLSGPHCQVMFSGQTVLLSQSDLQHAVGGFFPVAPDSIKVVSQEFLGRLRAAAAMSEEIYQKIPESEFLGYTEDSCTLPKFVRLSASHFKQMMPGLRIGDKVMVTSGEECYRGLAAEVTELPGYTDAPHRVKIIAQYSAHRGQVLRQNRRDLVLVSDFLRPGFQVNDAVMVWDENTPELHRKRGRITEVHGEACRVMVTDTYQFEFHNIVAYNLRHTEAARVVVLDEGDKPHPSPQTIWAEMADKFAIDKTVTTSAPATAPIAAATVATPAPVEEIRCPVQRCGKPNDAGVRSCWNCGHTF